MLNFTIIVIITITLIQLTINYFIFFYFNINCIQNECERNCFCGDDMVV